MSMKPAAFGEYRPDISDINAKYSGSILNAKPRADGWGPQPDLTAFSQALGERCYGAYYALNADNSVTVFAATLTRLYMLDNTTQEFSDVSQGATDYAQVADGKLWVFEQFGNFLLATHDGIDIQHFDLGIDTEFSDLPGSPPRCNWMAVINEQLFIAQIVGFPKRVQWSGLFAVTVWDGTQSGGYQDFNAGGAVLAVTGDESAIVIQEEATRRGVFVPGSALIWDFSQTIAGNIGCTLPWAIVNAAGTVAFPSNKGFVAISPLGEMSFIGKEKVDRTFEADHDADLPALVQGAAAPEETVILWAYKRKSTVGTVFDRFLAYDYGQSPPRWYPFDASGQFLFGMSQPGVTLDSIETILEDLGDISLDDFPLRFKPRTAVFNTDGRIAFFVGANMEATIETSEQTGFEGRTFINAVMPITDAPDFLASLAGRETLQETPAYGDEAGPADGGICPLELSTRYARVKLRIPAATEWSFATGVRFDAQSDGEF